MVERGPGRRAAAHRPNLGAEFSREPRSSGPESPKWIGQETDERTEAEDAALSSRLFTRTASRATNRCVHAV